MATSAFPLAVRALVTLLRAQPGYRDPASTALGGITVYAGPQRSTTKDPGDCVEIGRTPDGDEAGDVSQDVAALATTRPRDEEGRILCAASSQVGGLDPLDALDGVFAVLAGVENLLRLVDPTLGLRGPGAGQFQTFTAQLGEASSVVWESAGEGRGFRCTVPFTVTYKARL